MEQKSNIELQIQDLEREVNSLSEKIQEHESVKNMVDHYIRCRVMLKLLTINK